MEHYERFVDDHELLAKARANAVANPVPQKPIEDLRNLIYWQFLKRENKSQTFDQWIKSREDA